MLTALSIRDVVLIERLDLEFAGGLTVLTGETGAGKSILLDSLGLALGARGDAGLVRAGTEQAVVTGCFEVPGTHPAWALLGEQGIEAEGDLVLRRVVGRDGRSRAFVNDQPVGVALLRRLGALLVEVQGQHEQMGLADPSGHGALLDAFAVPTRLTEAVATAWRSWLATTEALASARAALAAAQREEDWLRHAAGELAELAPVEGEEAALAAERQRLQQAERGAEAIAAALADLAPRERRNAGPGAALRAAARALTRLMPRDGGSPPETVALALAAIERAEEAVAEAETLLSRLATEAEADPRLLERAEERLFALRAAARKHAISVLELPALLAELRSRLERLDSGVSALTELEAAAAETRGTYIEAAAALRTARKNAAEKLDRAVACELPPLRLDRARFVADVVALEESAWGMSGSESVRFLIATNPGETPGPLGRVASGGELSRLMLALKVVLSSGSPVPTLVFDEVDSGIGGATAAAVGERLAQVAERLQVLVVTHSPQVAARGAHHLRVAKQAAHGRATTEVHRLESPMRREEIARMLAGETVTEAARAAADSLLHGHEEKPGAPPPDQAGGRGSKIPLLVRNRPARSPMPRTKKGTDV